MSPRLLQTDTLITDELGSTMEEDSGRKRRGLVIFSFLLALLLACTAAFFMSSKHLSIAAAFVDETVGSMESYSVVIFKGTAVDETLIGTDKTIISADEAQISTDSSPDATSSSSNSASSASSGTTSTSSEKKSKDKLSTLPPSNTMQEAFTSESTLSSPNNFDLSDFIMSLFARASKQTENDREKLFVSDINDIYSSKGAETLTLNLDDLDRYTQPVIYKKGNKRIAVFSVDRYISRVKLNALTSDLQDQDVDFIIAITPRTELISTFDDIDACIITTATDEVEDRASDKTLIAVSPNTTEVGALIITSNNMAHLKTIKEL